jgi:hypothetical protein
MPWIVAPAHRGTGRGSLQGRVVCICPAPGRVQGRPEECVHPDDEDPCTFYWPTTMEFAYLG